ncbi:MAG TPA: LamG domain-containing protein [Acidimicrobiia bacterium]
MTILSQLQAAGLPISNVAIGDALTQGGQLGPHAGRNSTEFTTGENTAVYPVTITWSSGPTAAQENLARQVLGGGYILSSDARSEGGGGGSTADFLLTFDEGSFLRSDVPLTNAGADITLLAGDTVLDQSSNGYLGTLTNGMTQTADGAYGFGLRGGTGRIEFPDAQFGLEGDFTLEFDFYRAVIGSDGRCFGRYDTTGNQRSWLVTVNANTVAQFSISTNGTGNVFYSANTILQAATWYHIAICRSGDQLRIFVDGVLDGSWTVASVPFATTIPLHIGAAVRTLPMNANIRLDNIRIHDGLALYASDDSFTPPGAGIT